MPSLFYQPQPCSPSSHEEYIVLFDWMFVVPIVWRARTGIRPTNRLSCLTYDAISSLSCVPACKHVVFLCLAFLVFSNMSNSSRVQLTLKSQPLSPGVWWLVTFMPSLCLCGVVCRLLLL